MRWAPLLLAVILGVLVSRVPKLEPKEKPAPPVKPVLALELPTSNAEVQSLLAGDARQQAAKNTAWDYGFISLYLLLFLSFALLHDWPLRAALVIVAVAAATFDYWENAVIERFIADPASAMPRDIWFPACAKWFCFFVAVLLIAPLFRQRWWLVVAAALAIPALAGAIAALIGNRVLIAHATGQAIAALLIAVLAVPFTTSPRRAPSAGGSPGTSSTSR